jgi:hypothetical protein
MTESIAFESDGFDNSVVFLWLTHARLQQHRRLEDKDGFHKAIKIISKGREYDIVGFGSYWLEYLWFNLSVACLQGRERNSQPSANLAVPTDSYRMPPIPAKSRQGVSPNGIPFIDPSVFGVVRQGGRVENAEDSLSNSPYGS